MLDCSPANRERELGLDHCEKVRVVAFNSVREEPLMQTFGICAWLKSQWREATICWIISESMPEHNDLPRQIAGEQG